MVLNPGPAGGFGELVTAGAAAVEAPPPAEEAVMVSGYQLQPQQ